MHELIKGKGVKKLAFVNFTSCRYNLGAFYFATSYYARAKFQFTEAHKVFSAFLGPDHEDTASALGAMQAI